MTSTSSLLTSPTCSRPRTRPALFTRLGQSRQSGAHISISVSASFETTLSIALRSCMSACNVVTLPSYPLSLSSASHDLATSAKASFLRASRTTLAPARAKRVAVAAPMPLEAPVMRATVSKVVSAVYLSSPRGCCQLSLKLEAHRDESKTLLLAMPRMLRSERPREVVARVANHFAAIMYCCQE